MGEVCTKQEAIEYIVKELDDELEMLKDIFSRLSKDHGANLRWVGYIVHIFSDYRDKIAILTEIEVSPDNKDLSDIINLYKNFRTKTTATNEPADEETSETGGQYI